MPARITFHVDDLMERLRAARGRRVSWRDVAVETGISPQMLSKLRHGESVVTNLATLVTLRQYFGCHQWDELFTVEWPANADEVRMDQLFPGRRTWQQN